MSVIAAKVGADYIQVAADSILIKEEMKRTKNFSKLIQFNGIVAGGAGSAEELSLFFRFINNLNKPDSATVAGIQDFMRSFDRWKESYTNTTGIDNCYLIVYKGKLFEIDGIFVQEISDYTAIGEGEPYAITALHLGCMPTEAVKVTCDLCHSVCEPVVEFTVDRSN